MDIIGLLEQFSTDHQRLLGTNLHSSNEPVELLQWPCHDDGIINIILSTAIVRIYEFTALYRTCLKFY